jgi:hypothetical protein
MPKPAEGEDKDTFISRCIRYLRREGMTEQKAILGKCYGLWRQKHPSEPPPKKG